MTAPPVVDAPLKRPPWGWILFWSIVLFMVSTQLFMYLNRPVSDADPYQQDREMLRSVVRSEMAMKAMFTMAAVPGKTTDLKSSLETPLSRLAGKRKNDVRATALYTVIRFEKGRIPDKDDLERLRSSKTPEHKVLADIYGAKELGRDQAEALAAKLPKKQFTYALAAGHALERAGVKDGRARFIPRKGALLAFTTQLLAFLAVMLGSCLLVLYIVMRLGGKLIPLGHPSHNLSANGADIYAMRASQILILFFLIQAFVGLGLQLVLPSERSAAGELVPNKWINIATPVLLLGLLALLLKTPIFGYRIDRSSIGLHRRDFWKNVGWGVGGALASLPVTLCLAQIGINLFKNLPPPMHPVALELQSSPNILTVVAIFLAASLVAPILEEICFRGHVLPAMSSLFGSIGVGIVSSSLVFAAIHPTGVPAWFALASIGAFAAMLTYQTRSLVPAMVMHFVNNTSILILVLLSA